MWFNSLKVPDAMIATPQATHLGPSIIVKHRKEYDYSIRANKALGLSHCLLNMLQDTTNTCKTFSRKPKAVKQQPNEVESNVVDKATSSSSPGLGATQQSLVESPASSSLGSNESPLLATHTSNTGSAATRSLSKEYSWLGLRGRHRRSSVLMPNVVQGGIVSLAQHQASAAQRAKVAAQRRVHTVNEIIQQLVDYYLEVDAEELIEESPEKASCRKSTTRGKTKGDKQHTVHADKAVPAPAEEEPDQDFLASPDTTPCKATPPTPPAAAARRSDVQEEQGESGVRVRAGQSDTVPDPDAASTALGRLSLHCQAPHQEQACQLQLLSSPGSCTGAGADQQGCDTVGAGTTSDQDDDQTAEDSQCAVCDTASGGDGDSGVRTTGIITRQSGPSAARLSLPPPAAPPPAAGRPPRRGSTNSSHVSAPSTQLEAAPQPLPRRSSMHRRSSVKLISVQEEVLEVSGGGGSGLVAAAGDSAGRAGLPSTSSVAAPPVAGPAGRRWTLDPAAQSGSSKVSSGRRTRSSIRVSLMPTTLLAPLHEHDEEGDEEQHDDEAAAGMAQEEQGWSAQCSDDDDDVAVCDLPGQHQHQVASPAARVCGGTQDECAGVSRVTVPEPHEAEREGSCSVATLELQPADSTCVDNSVTTALDQQQLSPLQQLLKICDQSVDVCDIPDMSTFLSGFVEVRKVVKVGEGTYGEAFKYGTTVFKVIPIEGKQEVNGGVQKAAGEVAAEALMALTLSSLRRTETQGNTAGAAQQQHMTTGFVETHQVGVCRGPYPPALVRAWHKWDKSHGSENEPVDQLVEPGQLFLVLAMGDCGKDLEKAAVPGFDQARAVLAQVCFALAVAESSLEFEHRDLHWGNVMLRPTTTPWLPCRLSGVDLQLASQGLAVCLIDFTASRLRTPAGLVAYCDLSQDEELFQGPAKHIQFDTYRWMRQLTGDDWERPCLATNCLWMSYLADILLVEKGSGYSAPHKRALREFRKRAAQAASCTALVDDPLFDGLWRPQAQC